MVYKRVPPHLIAQVFATQSAVSSIATLLPTFLAGALLDLLPVETVLVAFAAGLAVLALAAFRGAPKAAAADGTDAPASN